MSYSESRSFGKESPIHYKKEMLHRSAPSEGPKVIKLISQTS